MMWMEVRPPGKNFNVVYKYFCHYCLERCARKDKRRKDGVQYKTTSKLEKHIEVQNELLDCIDCDKIYHPETRTDNIEYSDIFSNDINKQSTVTKLFTSLLERREVASANSTGPQCCPGVPGECSNPCSKL